MSTELDQRYAELRALEARAIRWARQRTDVAAVVLVGSFARGEARLDSDIDLLLLVEDPQPLNTDTSWLDVLAPGAAPLRTGQWGPVTEHRVIASTGLELEFGIAAPSWAALPLDPGTAGVLRDSARPIHDPGQLIATAIDNAQRHP